MRLDKISEYFAPTRILDIGANIGQFRTLASKFYPDSYIFSIEASQACEPYLANITDQYMITLLAKDRSEYNFYSRKGYPTGTGHSMYKELTQFYSDDQLEVLQQSGRMLQDIFPAEEVFDLIKIDTQGSELDIIQGGEDLVSKAKGVLLEVSITEYNEGAPLYDEVVRFMKERSFVPVAVVDEARNHGSHQQDILFINEK